MILLISLFTSGLLLLGLFASGFILAMGLPLYIFWRGNRRLKVIMKTWQPSDGNEGLWAELGQDGWAMGVDWMADDNEGPWDELDQAVRDVRRAARALAADWDDLQKENRKKNPF